MTRTGLLSIGGRAVAFTALLALSASSSAWSQMAVDPLTGATPDPAAALGAKAYEAVYFDSKGNVTEDASKAVKYSVTDNVQGISTIPKPMSQMTPQDREKLGMPSTPADPQGDAKTPDAKQDEKAPADAKNEKPLAAAPEAGVPAPEAGRPAPKATQASAGEDNGNPNHVKGSEETDPQTGIEYGTIKPQLVQAAMDSYGEKAGADAAVGTPPSTIPAASGDGGAAYAYVAPAVAAQVEALQASGAAPRGYRALSALVSLRDSLISGIQRYFGDDSSASLTRYGAAYDGSAARGAPADSTRACDVRFGVLQQEIH